MKIIFLEKFIACFQTDYKNNTIFKQLVEFHKTQKKIDVSSEEQEIYFSEFKPFLKNNTKFFNPLFSFLQQWQSSHPISLFLEQWRIQDSGQWNENNKLLSLPNDILVHHILPKLDERSQSSFFQVCRKTHAFGRPDEFAFINDLVAILHSISISAMIEKYNNKKISKS